MHIVYADGIGSSVPDYKDVILNKVVVRLTELMPSAEVTRVNWPASMSMVGGIEYSWTDATLMGVADINRIVHDNPDDEFILLGYSGGCRVVHEWLETNPNRLDKIAAVGFLSDPFRPRDRKQSELPETIGWGICGEKVGPIPERSFWTTVPSDVISDASANSILRTTADISDVMPGQYIRDLAGHLIKNDLQLAWEITTFRDNPLGWFLALGERIHQARLDIEGYLGGKHTTDYIEPFAGGDSLAVRLANTINWHVRHN